MLGKTEFKFEELNLCQEKLNSSLKSWIYVGTKLNSSLKNWIYVRRNWIQVWRTEFMLGQNWFNVLRTEFMSGKSKFMFGELNSRLENQIHVW